MMGDPRNNPPISAPPTTDLLSSPSGLKRAEKRKAPRKDRRNGRAAPASPGALPRDRIRFNRATSRWEGITVADLRAWGRCWPGVNLTRVLEEAAVYLRGERPGKYKNLDRFLRNQFRRASRPPRRTPVPAGYEPLARLLGAPARSRTREVATAGDTLRRALGIGPRETDAMCDG